MANVGIVGGGIAGATAAAVLRKAGHDVTLYARAGVLREVGAVFTIQPNGLKLLATLGIQNEIEEEASLIPHPVVRNKSGDVVPVVATPVHCGRKQQAWSVDIVGEKNEKLLAKGQLRCQNVPMGF